MPNLRRFKKGLTLVEVMVSLLIFLVVLMALYQLFETSHSTYSSGTRRQDVQQQARLAMEEIVRSLRMAGYVSENYDGDGTNDLPAGTARIHIATPNALAVFGNLDGSVYNAGPPVVPASHVFFYCPIPQPDGSNRLLIKRSTDPTDVRTYTCDTTTATYVTAGVQHSITADVLADNVSLLRFTFFDQNGAQITGTGGNLDNKAPSNALNLTPRTERDAVRTIVVTLQTTETAPHQKTQVYMLTSTVRLRNLNNL